MFRVFRVKNNDFTPKNHIFSNFRGARAGCAAPPPWIRPWFSLPLTGLYYMLHNIVFHSLFSTSLLFEHLRHLIRNAHLLNLKMVYSLS